MSAGSKAGVVMQLTDLLDTATADPVKNIRGFDKVPEGTGRSVTLWTRDIRYKPPVDKLAEDPLHYAVVGKARRRAGVRRFPYGLFFLVEDSRIVVIACFHGKRSPKH